MDPDIAATKIQKVQASPFNKRHYNLLNACMLYTLGGVCGQMVNTSNSGSGGPGFKPCASCCFLRQGTLLHFASLQPVV